MSDKNIILFIDDEKICHTLVKLIIGNFTNYKVISAYSGRSALELAKMYASDIAIILCDIILPDMNGHQIYSKIREQKKFLKVPFIFQSGLFFQEEELKQYVNEGVRILQKPYNKFELLEELQNAFRKAER